ncbi:NlpC/P60 family protein [Ferrimonas pelagia]|uniref:NlpC/P60 family protein n=1 Tax=Ferrimonas pelagia TaxID=1177826 RepID=A0ABP9FEY5_9GAMM
MFRSCLHHFRLLLPALLLIGCAHNPAQLSSVSPTSAATNEQRITQALSAQHQAWAGVPHRWGGNSKQGIDCSALVQLTYRDHFAVALPRTTAEQVQIGSPIRRSAIAPGDLVFFKTGANVRHVGMMLDEITFLHTSYSRGVMLSRLDNPYWSANYWQARRVL